MVEPPTLYPLFSAMAIVSMNRNIDKCKKKMLVIIIIKFLYYFYLRDIEIAEFAMEILPSKN